MEFTPEQKVLNDLFGRDMTYIIPEYQRPYSWDSIGKSDKNNQVNVMWQDLFDFYRSNRKNEDKIYFMGSMVVVSHNEARREYEVVDGQQRLTTLTLLFAAIKCFAKEVIENNWVTDQTLLVLLDNVKSTIDDIIFNRNQNIDLYMVIEKKVKIQTSVGFNYDNVLDMVLKCENIPDLLLNGVDREEREVAERYLKNRQYFIEQLKSEFLDRNETNQLVLSRQNIMDIGSFFNFLMRKVSIVQIKTSRFEFAYQIFEILNNRGLPLSNKDLFRNFLISRFFQLKSSRPVEFSDLVPSLKWKYLETHYELDTEFISRYVESKRARKQQYSAFNDLQDIYNDNNLFNEVGNHRIELFYQDIEAYLAVYTRILRREFANRQIRNIVSFLLETGKTGYVLNLLVALFRQNYSQIEILAFLKDYELSTIYMLLGTTRFSHRPIFEAIEMLNNRDINGAHAKFILEIPQRQELINLFNESIEDNDIARLMILRYYYATDNLQADEDITTQNIDFDKATLEHIIPQKPDADTNWLIDFSDVFREENTNKLGNMTLITQRLNSAAKNYDFARKRNIYSRTRLNMTREIAAVLEMNENYITTRHQQIVRILLNDLGI